MLFIFHEYVLLIIYMTLRYSASCRLQPCPSLFSPEGRLILFFLPAVQVACQLSSDEYVYAKQTWEWDFNSPFSLFQLMILWF